MQELLIEIIPYITMALSVIIGLLNMVYTRKTGKSIDTEVTSMKYRTAQYRDSENTKPYAQSFSPLVTQYRLNKETNELEELPDKLDVQKLVDSSLNTALEAMFDKFMPREVKDGAVVDLTDTRDKLDILSQAMQSADELKESLGMDEFATLEDIQLKLQELEQQQMQAIERKKLEDEQANKTLFEQFQAFVASQSDKGGDK